MKHLILPISCELKRKAAKSRQGEQSIL